MTEEYPPPEITPSPQIDTTVSHSARVWDYWLGGKDNYPVDRQVGDRIAQMLLRHHRLQQLTGPARPNGRRSPQASARTSA